MFHLLVSCIPLGLSCARRQRKDAPPGSRQSSFFDLGVFTRVSPAATFLREWAICRSTLWHLPHLEPDGRRPRPAGPAPFAALRRLASIVLALGDAWKL